MEYSFSGKVIGEVDVYFEIYEDVVVVMFKDWFYVYYRYIELFLNLCLKGK